MNNTKPAPTQAGEFKKSEWKNRWPDLEVAQFRNFGLMLIVTLDLLQYTVRRAYDILGWKYHINSSYRKNDPKSHGRGEAIDGYFYKDKPGDIELADQVLFILQYDWRGIGYYPHWKTPGWHVDTRTGHEWKNRRAIWRRNKTVKGKKGTYAMGFSGAKEALNA